LADRHQYRRQHGNDRDDDKQLDEGEGSQTTVRRLRHGGMELWDLEPTANPAICADDSAKNQHIPAKGHLLATARGRRFARHHVGVEVDGALHGTPASTDPCECPKL
jgi:hypothetical protein